MIDAFFEWFKRKLIPRHCCLSIRHYAYQDWLWFIVSTGMWINYEDRGDVRPFLLFPAYWFIVTSFRTILELSIFLIIAWLLGVARLARLLQHTQKVLSTSDVHPVDLQSCTTNTNRSDTPRHIFTTFAMQGMMRLYKKIMQEVLSWANNGKNIVVTWYAQCNFILFEDKVSFFAYVNNVVFFTTFLTYFLSYFLSLSFSHLYFGTKTCCSEKPKIKLQIEI